MTTEVTGEGRSPGPWSDEAIDEINRTRPKGYPEVSWRTLGDYMRFLEDRGSAINFAFYVGATNAREIVLGRNNRQPNEAERKKGREVAANVYLYAATATALTALAPHLGARRGI